MYIKMNQSCKRRVKKKVVHCPKENQPYVMHNVAPTPVCCGHLYSVKCYLNGKIITGLVDSGSQVTVISPVLLARLGIVPDIREAKIVMNTASGSDSKPSGAFKGMIKFKGRTFEQDIFVLESLDEKIILLGTDFCFAAKLVIDFFLKTVRFRNKFEICDDGEDKSAETRLNTWKSLPSLALPWRNTTEECTTRNKNCKCSRTASEVQKWNRSKTIPKEKKVSPKMVN